MKVWRYQHKRTGEGPYTGPHGIEAMRLAHMDPETHPQPMELVFYDYHGETVLGKEFDSYPGPDYYYGFLTKTGAHSWFRGWEYELDKKGFLLVEVEASVVIVSNSKKQVAFTYA